MTTVIVKGADFSAGELLHYSPPVSGATLCAFVGEDRLSAALKNYGTGADLSVNQGDPKAQGDGFRRFGPFDSFLTPAFYTASTTILLVSRSVYPLTDQFGIVISSERDDADGGRRGGGFARINNADYLRMYASGTLSGAPTAPSANTQIAGITAANSAGFFSGTISPGTVANTINISAARVTTPAVSRTTTSDPNATLAPAANEASFPFLVGSHYRAGANFAPVDIGFVAVFPRLLSAAEIATMYTSVKKRFASRGITV